MNNLDNNDQMADYLRLSNLKSLYPNRLRGRQDLDFAEMQNPDLAGTAMLQPLAPSIEESIGNFDVRANQLIAPPPMQQGPAAQDSNMYSQLQGLGMEAPPMQQDIPAPNNLTERMPMPEFDNSPESLGLLGSNINTYLGNDVNNSPHELIYPGGQPENLNTEIPNNLNNQTPQNLNTESQQSLQEPGAQVIPGSVAEVMADPSLRAKIDEKFGAIDPEMAQAASSYENAMNAYANQLDATTARLNEQEKSILDRIESRNLSTQDKILMALALAAPVIISGIFGGKEGALGAIGGGAKGLAEAVGGRDKASREDKELLSGIALDRAKIAKDKASTIPLTAEFKTKLAENIPNHELRNIFMRDGELRGEKLVLNSGNPDLPIKADAVRDVADYKRLKGEVPKQAKSLATLEKAESLMNNLYELADMSSFASENKNLLQQGLSYAPFSLYDYASGALKAFIPATRETVKDETGKEYKISELMSTYRAQLADAWRDAHGNSSNAFKATEAHFDKQLPDPNAWNSFIYGQSSNNQFKKQLDAVNVNFKEALNYIDNLGFDVSELKQKYSTSKRKEQIQKYQTDKKRAEDAANDAISKNQRK